MRLKSLLRAMLLGAAAVSATAVSAQDWWNPGSWISPRPHYGYTTRYGGSGSSCANGACRPSYGTGYYHGQGNPGWSGYRPPTYAPVSPNYRPNDSERFGDYEAYDRSPPFSRPQTSRPRSSPFYE
jgi:hypothetical protein